MSSVKAVFLLSFLVSSGIETMDAIRLNREKLTKIKQGLGIRQAGAVATASTEEDAKKEAKAEEVADSAVEEGSNMLSCMVSARLLLGSNMVSCSEGSCRIGYIAPPGRIDDQPSLADRIDRYCPTKLVSLVEIAQACPGDTLTKIDFYMCEKVTGDINALSSMTKLTYLGLGETKVSGSINDLASLTNLEIVWLSDTSVSGSIHALSPLTHLQELSLTDTGVTGDIKDLASLRALVQVWLLGSKVTGTCWDIPYPKFGCTANERRVF